MSHNLRIIHKSFGYYIQDGYMELVCHHTGIMACIVNQPSMSGSGYIRRFMNFSASHELMRNGFKITAHAKIREISEPNEAL